MADNGSWLGGFVMSSEVEIEGDADLFIDQMGVVKEMAALEEFFAVVSHDGKHSLLFLREIIPKGAEERVDVVDRVAIAVLDELDIFLALVRPEIGDDACDGGKRGLFVFRPAIIEVGCI